MFQAHCRQDAGCGGLPVEAWRGRRLWRSAAGCCQQRGYVASRGLRYALAFWAFQSACSLHVARQSAMKPRMLVLVALVAFVEAVAGVFLGRHFPPHLLVGGVETCGRRYVWGRG